MNYLIDLDQAEDTLWRNISKSGRQSVRTSINKGTIIEQVTDRRQLMVAYPLLQNVYSRVQVPIAHMSLFEAAYDILAPKELFKIFLARLGDRYIGTCFILMYKRRIIDWYAGSDRSFPSSGSGELIIWRILQWGREHGFHLFDFGGGGKPTQEYGPRAYKAKFGGEAVYYGRNICIHSPFSLQVSKQVYTWMRRVSLNRSLNLSHHQNNENP
jgi:lipid II:glycine glycyltransferase (peptidoglycan interpeptide bridge formation enzyme)